MVKGTSSLESTGVESLVLFHTEDFLSQLSWSFRGENGMDCTLMFLDTDRFDNIFKSATCNLKFWV